MDGWHKFGVEFLKRISPHGPTPVLCGTVAIVGMTALVLGAPGWAIVALAIMVLGTHILAMERKASWEREEIRNTIDRKMAEGKIAVSPLRRRLDAKKRQLEPTLFDEPNEEGNEE